VTPRSRRPTHNEVSRLQSLLAVSILVSERSDELEVLRVAATAVPSLSVCSVAGVWRTGVGWWTLESGSTEAPNVPLAILGWVEAGGTGEPPGDRRDWLHASELRGLDGLFGAVLLEARTAPPEDEQLLLRVFAQFMGLALSSTRIHARAVANATELRTANARLAASARTLERSNAIHTRLTAVVAGGGGERSIAEAVHALTSLPVAVEDEYGELRAWAGGDPPDPYPQNARPRTRAALIERASLSGKPVREDGRLVAVTSTRGEERGVLALIDPDGIAGLSEETALEYGATVLAMELACLRAVAETELRLGRDLVEDILAGADEEAIFRRARARDFDLHRPHRAVVVMAGDPGDIDGLFDAVRRSARDHRLGTLVATRGTTVVLVSNVDCDWEAFRVSIEDDVPGTRVGVGGVCKRPTDFARSHREAAAALRLQAAAGSARGAVRFEDLGVYSILADVTDPHAVEGFVRRWLGTLLEYDRAHATDLVNTLDVYFKSGGSYDATAKTLHLHRNTLKYRLQRVREVSGHDLSDAETKFNLQLATRVWGTLIALRTVGSSEGPPPPSRSS
jgi:hypothetical protein